MTEKGVLLIHGFAGGRYEVAPLGAYLSNLGYRVAMPKLSGHEETRAALGRASYRDWIASGAGAYEALAGACGGVTVVGFSMGGLIAVQLYQTYHFERLVTINLPVRVWDLRLAARNLARDFGTHARRYLDNGAKMSPASTAQFLRLRAATLPLISSVRCPALIFQAQDDDTVHRKSADYVYDRLPGEKRLIQVPSGGHQVLLTGGIDQIAPRVAEFIEGS